MKIHIFLLAFITSGLVAMEPAPRKRGAPEIAEQATQKTQKIEYDKVYWMASLAGLPYELKLMLVENLFDAPGADNAHKLLHAATNIRNLFRINKQYKKLLDDVELTGNIIRTLAQRYTNDDLVHAAITFNTNAASKWLAAQIQQQLIGPDGRLLSEEELQSDPLRVTLHRAVQRALDFAVNQNRVDILRFLLEHQPKLADWRVNSQIFNAQDQFPLLEVALFQQNLPMVRILLKAGAKITDAIVTAAAVHNTPFALEQLKKAGVNLSALFDGNSLFHFADNEQVIAYLAAQGVPINAENSTGITPLQQALYNSHYDLANVLLAYGADPNIPNEFIDTALHSAIIKNAPHEIIARIVEKITNLETANSDGNTPLALAILNYNLPAMELLFKRGAVLPPFVYQSDVHGDVVPITPLTFVLRMPLPVDPQVLTKIIELLLFQGADPNEVITDPNTGTQTTVLARMQNDPFSRTPLFLNIIAMLKAFGAHE